MRPRTIRGVAAGLVLALTLLTAAPSARSEEYTIGPGDVLDVAVLGEWSAPAPVSPDGKIVGLF